MPNAYNRLSTLVETGNTAENKINMLSILNAHILIAMAGESAYRQPVSEQTQDNFGLW